MNIDFNSDYSLYWDNYKLCIQKIDEDIKKIKDNEKLYSIDLYIEILNNRIKLNFEYSHYKEALLDIEEVISLSKSIDILYFIYINKGKVYQKLNRIKDAEECYDKAINFNPTEYLGYSEKAFFYYTIQKYNEAIDCYDMAIKNGSIIALYQKAFIYYRIKNYKEAVNCIDKYFEQKIIFNSFDYYHKALYYGLINNINVAYESFIKGLEEDHYSTKNLIDMALIIENNDFNDKLEELTKKALCYDFKMKDDIIKNNLLYKYRNIDINTIKLLQNNTLRLSDFNYFNDPADPPIKLNIHHLGKISNYINSIKIASLSATNNNILMWSHYANNHQGICIEYDITNYKELNKSIENIILKKVKYTDKIYFGYLDHILKMDNYQQRFIDFFYLKHKNWKYENEYRIISYNSIEELHLPIKAIYFGMNTTEDNIKLIKDIMKGRKIKFYQMKPNKQNLYKLDSINL